jgi:predicted enzyme related to lactoylglutathione lyase
VKGRNPIFIHYVHDMARAQRFYESVFGVSTSFASPGWTMLHFGTFELALHILSPGHADDSPLPNAGLCLEVDQIEEMQELIERHGGKMIVLREAQPPQVPPRVASFRDCEGNGFDLRQYVNQER